MKPTAAHDKALRAPPASKDMRSPLHRARDEWFASPMGRSCARGAPSGEVLRNVLLHAFAAGAEAMRAAILRPPARRQTTIDMPRAATEAAARRSDP